MTSTASILAAASFPDTPELGWIGLGAILSWIVWCVFFGLTLHMLERRPGRHRVGLVRGLPLALPRTLRQRRAAAATSVPAVQPTAAPPPPPSGPGAPPHAWHPGWQPLATATPAVVPAVRQRAEVAR